MVKEGKSDLQDYIRGVKNGIPVCLGYLPIAFAFGVAVSNKDYPLWMAMVMALTNFTGTAQFAALNMIAAGKMFLDVVFTVFIVNARYILMSMSLSQRLEDKVGILERLLLSFFHVDEIFVIAMQEKGYISSKYFFGLATFPYISWGIGTLLGGVIGGVLPEVVGVSFEIALYAMFAAILIPAAKRSKPILFTIAISIIIDCSLQLVPVVKDWPETILILIAAGISAVVCAQKYPVDVDEKEEVPA